MADPITVLMQVPMDLMNLAVRHATETMNVFNAGVQNLAASLPVPPAFPSGLPALPSGLPAIQSLLPPLPGVAGTTVPGVAAARAGFGEMASIYKAPPRVII